MDAQLQDDSPTQHYFRQRLKRLYRKNSRVSHSEELRKALFDYFVFLEQSITGGCAPECFEDEFSIPELEAMNRYNEALLSMLRRNGLRDVDAKFAVNSA